jgi:hypothetical protein
VSSSLTVGRQVRLGLPPSPELEARDVAMLEASVAVGVLAALAACGDPLDAPPGTCGLCRARDRHLDHCPWLLAQPPGSLP